MIDQGGDSRLLVCFNAKDTLRLLVNAHIIPRGTPNPPNLSVLCNGVVVVREFHFSQPGADWHLLLDPLLGENATHAVVFRGANKF